MGAGTQGWGLGQEEILQASIKTPPSPTHSPGWCRVRERSALMMRSATLMNPFGKGVTTTSSRLPLWPATSSQKCSY